MAALRRPGGNVEKSATIRDQKIQKRPKTTNLMAVEKPSFCILRISHISLPEQMIVAALISDSATNGDKSFASAMFNNN